MNNTQSQAVVLTVQTNAASGYTLAASDTGLSRSAPTFTIPAVSSGPTVGVSTFPTSGWGASAALDHRRDRRGGARLGTLGGANSSATRAHRANSSTATGPTGATPDTLTLTNQVAVDYTVPGGSYTDTITYVVTPSF